MKIGSKTTSAILALSALFLLQGCASRDVVVDDYAIRADTTGLVANPFAEPTIVLLRPDAPPLAEYDRFIVDWVQVNYDDPSMQELEPEQVLEMQQYFFDAMVSELREAGYEVGTRSAPGTMRISFLVSGLKAPNPAANVSVAVAPIAISVGEVTVEAVFREAMSNRIDAVVVGRSQGSRVFNSSPWSSWADVESTFNAWAEGIRQAIDESHASSDQ